MRILLISQYFFPETGATSNRIYSLAKSFIKKGHDVRVIAEKPNHPEGVFSEGYKDGWFIDGMYKGVPVTYTWVHTKPEKNFVDRILFYVSFMIMAIFASFRLKQDYDAVIASSPPLFVGIAGWLAAKITKAKFVFDVRDIWPDVAVAMGELNNKLAIRLAENVEEFIYKKADLITTVTNSFKNTISEKGIPVSQIEIIANGTNPDVFNVNTSKKELRDSLGLRDSFLIGYVGNIGLAQGLEHIIDTALEIDKMEIYDIEFVIVGAGPKKKKIKVSAEEKKLTNINFVERVPLERAAQYMNAVDVLLVPLANEAIYSQFIPSKLFDSMAAAKPILLSVDGESRKILKEAAAGYYYPAEDSKKLTKKIVSLYGDKNGASMMGERGRNFVIKNYTRKVQAEKMLVSIKELLS